ncbi:hypothetical protein AVEN_254490-1 [Araneus ventricosus]|uniref:Uncharacterized protein n=1 Tax=Araneus ventricosus TaxID=182803 RepID=A0A4Y2LV52_ARAVE|nr:hypothetical protein AVEN_254490-1 [Araneus ventricosus]
MEWSTDECPALEFRPHHSNCLRSFALTKPEERPPKRISLVESKRGNSPCGGGGQMGGSKSETWNLPKQGVSKTNFGTAVNDLPKFFRLEWVGCWDK